MVNFFFLKTTPLPRPSTYISYDNQTLTVQQWSDKTGVSPRTIRNRLKKGVKMDKLFLLDRANKRNKKPVEKSIKPAYTIPLWLYLKAVRQVPDFYVEEFVAKYSPLIKQ